MKKIILFLAFITLFSCKENERLTYDANRSDVYFRDITKDNDSLYVSLLSKEDRSDALIPVKVLGGILSTPKKFRVEVVPEKSTAVEGKHYQKLPEYYEFTPDTTVYFMPVVMLKGDDAIKVKPVELTLRIVNSEEMGIAYEDRCEIRLVIADMLRVPTGTGNSGDMTIFKKLFGEYSRVKHLMIIDLVGHDFWDKDTTIDAQQAYYTPFARKLYKIITSGEYIDENGNVIQGWNVP